MGWNSQWNCKEKVEMEEMEFEHPICLLSFKILIFITFKNRSTVLQLLITTFKILEEWSLCFSQL